MPIHDPYIELTPDNLTAEGLYSTTDKIRIGDQLVNKSSVKSLIFGEAFRDVTAINDNFLIDYPNLWYVDLGGFEHVTSIGDNFLKNATSLTKIDFIFAEGITSIGDDFLAGDILLDAFELPLMEQLTHLGGNFLAGSSLLDNIVDFSFDKTPNVTSIGNNFLRDIKSLKTVNFDALKYLSTVGDGFLQGCENLEVFNPDWIRGGASAIVIGNDFLRDCKKVDTQNGSWSRYAQIGDGFLTNCENLWKKYGKDGFRMDAYMDAFNTVNGCGLADTYMYVYPVKILGCKDPNSLHKKFPDKNGQDGLYRQLST
jgi:hypothetical protein